MHGISRSNRQRQSMWISIANIFGGEDHHPSGNKQRIFSGFDHPHHPIDRGVGIAAAHTFNKRRDDIVVLLATFIVQQRFMLRGFFGQGKIES
jgi:hypothetical protein